MFLRRCKRKKNGKQHTYWALVESYRTARGSRQRVVAYLGELEDNEQSGWTQLGKRLDRLLPHKQVIEKHLKERLGDLFDLKYDLLLYDVTSTYFEGECKDNPMAKRGYSRDSRPDCLQVCIGLVVTDDGMPLGYEVFDGNTHDSKTVEDIVRAMESEYGRANRIWVMDRGMVSENNLRFVRQRGGSYIVGTPKAVLRQFERYLTDKDWHEVQEGVEVKLVDGPDGEELFVLAQWLRRAGLGDAPRTLLEEFSKIKSGGVVLPTRTRNGQPKKTVRLRCVTTPDEAQKILLNRLGLILPQRLRRIDEIAQM